MDRSISDENPVVITCALTGSIHGKEANLNLPEQPEEIAKKCPVHRTLTSETNIKTRAA